MSKIKDFFGRDWTRAEKTLIVTTCIIVGALLGFMWAPIKKGISWNIVTDSYNNLDGEEEWLDEED